MMKKFMMVLVMILVLSACGEKVTEAETSGDPQTVIETSEPQETVAGTTTMVDPGVTEVSNRAQMYMAALDSLMEIDPGLNGDIEYISIDCNSLPDVDDNDVGAILNYFSEKYNIDTMNKSVTECYDEGYGKEEELYLYGIVLYVDEATIKNKKASLDCVKYRSGIGAIGVTVDLKYKDEWLVDESRMTWIS